MKHYWEDIEAEYSLQGNYMRGFDYDDEPEYSDEPPPMTIDDEIFAYAENIKRLIINAIINIEDAMDAETEMVEAYNGKVEVGTFESFESLIEVLHRELGKFD